MPSWKVHLSDPGDGANLTNAQECVYLLSSDAKTYHSYQLSAPPLRHSLNPHEGALGAEWPNNENMGKLAHLYHYHTVVTFWFDL
jgi:hypothetical protein